MTNKNPVMIKLWAAFADNDIAALKRMAEALDREFQESQYAISVLNEDWSLAEFLRNPSDTDDRVTEAMRTADYVLACMTPDLREEDMVAQLRRAHALGKEIIVFYYGRTCDSNGKAISPRFSADLFLLLQGARQVALWGSPTAELETIFSRAGSVPPQPTRPTVFLSHNHRDHELARKVHACLAQTGTATFLSEISLPQLGSCDYMKEIDKALECAKHMIVVGTSLENIMSGWVEAEWRLFINEKRSGRKTGNIVTVIDGELSAAQLPMSLRYFEVIDLRTEDLKRIGDYLS